MLTAIEIENFKGFGERQRIELAPITLLFGANSAGKSSFFHALFFLHQLFEEHRTTPQELSHFSDRIDLGGFLTAVHAHDPKRQMKFRLEFWVEEQDMDGIGINTWSPKCQKLGAGNYSLGASTLAVELTVSGGPDGYQGYVHQFKLEVDEDLLVELEVTGRGSDKFWNIDARFDFENLAAKVDLPERRDACWSTFYGYGALPNRYDPPLSTSIRINERIMDDDEQEFASEVDKMLLTAVEVVRETLNDLLYIGPMREVPPAEYSAQLRPPTSRWARGLAGWDALHYASQVQIDKVNYWLGPERLNSSVKIELQQMVPLTRFENISPLNFAELTPRIRIRPYCGSPPTPSNTVVRIQDVGCGVSQVVPVVAAFLIAHEH